MQFLGGQTIYKSFRNDSIRKVPVSVRSADRLCGFITIMARKRSVTQTGSRGIVSWEIITPAAILRCPQQLWNRNIKQS